MVGGAKEVDKVQHSEGGRKGNGDSNGDSNVVAEAELTGTLETHAGTVEEESEPIVPGDLCPAQRAPGRSFKRKFSLQMAVEHVMHAYNCLHRQHCMTAGLSPKQSGQL